MSSAVTKYRDLLVSSQDGYGQTILPMWNIKFQTTMDQVISNENRNQK